MSEQAACNHDTTYIGCESCVARYVAERDAADAAAREALLTGIQKAELEARRKRITLEDGVWAYFASLERMYVGEVRAE
jgi:hypothetical protein